MHELRLAEKIMDEAKRQGATSAIRIQVGDLAEVTADEIKEVLERYAPWKVTVETVKSNVRCSCGYTGEARIIEREHDYCLFNCPRCGKRPRVIAGGEIRLIGVE